MKNYFSLRVDEQVELVKPTLELAPVLYAVIDSDRAHLRRYLDFVDDCQEVTSQVNYFTMKLTAELAGTDYFYLIAVDGQIAGCIDLHAVSKPNQRGEIGYWLHSAQTGKGVMQKAVRQVCALAFHDLGLNKLSIVADVRNVPSNRVAQGCGFQLVGVEREEYCRDGVFSDFNRYALLKSEFLVS